MDYDGVVVVAEDLDDYQFEWNFEAVEVFLEAGVEADHFSYWEKLYL